MKRKVKKVFVLTIGIIFIILGLLGLVTPFLQGIIFLVIGLVLLSFASPKINTFIREHAKRYPKLASMINKTEIWLNKIIGRI